ncbi:MAG: hypothetical protein VW646_06650, partial [Hydrogenophilales bacterium]
MIKEKETMVRSNKLSEHHLRIIFGLFALTIVICITFFSSQIIWKIAALLISSYAFVEWLIIFEKRKINIFTLYLVFIILSFYFLNIIDNIFFELSLIF